MAEIYISQYKYLKGLCMKRKLNQFLLCVVPHIYVYVCIYIYTYNLEKKGKKPSEIV